MIKHLAWGYLAIVAIFAIINWVSFRNETTSFLISEQLNKKIRWYDFLTDSLDYEEYHSNVKDNMPITINGFNEIIKPLFAKLDSMNSMLVHKQDSLDIYVQIGDSLNTIATKSRDINIQLYKDSMLLDYQHKIDSMNNIIAANDSNQMILLGKYTERVKYKQAYAERMVEVSKLVVKNYGKFISKDLYDQIDTVNKHNLRFMSETNDLCLRKLSLTHDIRDMVNSFHQNRLESVGFLDFIYYSICVSTTVSFGDIAPNNCWTRFLAIVELLMCMLLLGMLLERISRKVNQHD